MSADVKQDIANEAVRIVTGARRAAYGTPEQNFQRIARLQAAYMASRAEPEAEIRPIDVAFLNLMQKVARICESPTHRDSFTDAVGYVLCAAEVAGVAVTEGPKGHSAELVEPEPAPLQIEAGKFYWTRDGRKVGPALGFGDDRDDEFPWYVEPHHYTPGGVSWYGPSSDIVAEWVDT